LVERCLQKGQAVGLPDSALLISRSEKTEFSVEVTSAPIQDSEDRIVGTVLVFHGVTKLRSLARQMSHQARHDPLTGLINRREFEAQLSDMLATYKCE
jgi:PleD family two-component response regulator